MTKVVEDTETGDRKALFEIQIEKDGSMGSPICFYVPNDRADYEALRISREMPGHRVALYALARFKAFYRNGVRDKVMDYKDFYSNLTPEQYAATKIQDSRTAEWI